MVAAGIAEADLVNEMIAAGEGEVGNIEIGIGCWVVVGKVGIPVVSIAVVVTFAVGVADGARMARLLNFD